MFTNLKAVSLDTANKILKAEVEDKQLELDTLQAPIHGESDALTPSLGYIRKIRIGKLKTEIRSIKKAIRINQYVLDNLK
jgi:Xaa-Pro aminopeptidase